MGRNKLLYSIIKKSNGYYYYRTYDLDGKLITTSLKTKKKGEAQKIILDLVKNDKLIPPKSNKLLFSTFALNFFDFDTSLFIKYQRDRGLINKKSYCQKNQGILNGHIMPFFKDYKLPDINKRVVLTFLDILESSNSHKNNIKAVLSIILGYAIELELIKVNPCKLIKDYKSDSKERIQK